MFIFILRQMFSNWNIIVFPDINLLPYPWCDPQEFELPAPLLGSSRPQLKYLSSTDITSKAYHSRWLLVTLCKYQMHVFCELVYGPAFGFVIWEGRLMMKSGWNRFGSYSRSFFAAFWICLISRVQLLLRHF